jgi:SAM-dependent methyltransferase
VADERALRLQLGGERIPLGYVREGARLFLIARERSAAWPVSVLRRGVAELELPDGTARGAVSLIPPGPDRVRVLGKFEAKYGRQQYLRWYDHPARVLAVSLGRADPEGIPSDRYYRWLETEFDSVAADYDHHILDNRMNRLLRDRSMAVLLPTFAGARHLLEVGCGSGIETIQMLRAGHEITAVDISAEMLREVREKARREGLSERLVTVRANASALGGADGGLGKDRFDGAYSTYGAINCEPRLLPLRRFFAKALSPGARLVLGVYNRWCLFELVAYTLTGQWQRAIGRRGAPIPVGGSRFCVDVYAYSPGEVRRGFAPEFESRAVSAVPLFLPPSDLTGYAEKFARHFETLDEWDLRLGRVPALAGLGDHFLMTLHRTQRALG